MGQKGTFSSYQREVSNVPTDTLNKWMQNPNRLINVADGSLGKTGLPKMIFISNGVIQFMKN
jgi:hypothetical protein